ncbi:MAG: hypothetical protein MSG64_10665 [Pyrinomonadaceae bacterium MAG19_C2-C3]|nr:hypothetical protein [Pyrinomonadaceae bacterium MAG19_C2-C3]
MKLEIASLFQSAPRLKSVVNAANHGLIPRKQAASEKVSLFQNTRQLAAVKFI